MSEVAKITHEKSQNEVIQLKADAFDLMSYREAVNRDIAIKLQEIMDRLKVLDGNNNVA